MLCSLKKYKGPDQFVALAQALPQQRFELVLNASEEDIKQYFENTSLPDNLQCFPRQSNVHPFYQRAHLVLNLSHPEEWIETFGMTILEAMHYALPCIGPNIGGPAEIIHHRKEGFLIDQRDQAALKSAILQLAIDEKLYHKFALAAQARAKDFSSHALIDQVETLLIEEALMV